jgi:hypothetical protein
MTTLQLLIQLLIAIIEAMATANSARSAASVGNWDDFNPDDELFDGGVTTVYDLEGREPDILNWDIDSEFDDPLDLGTGIFNPIFGLVTALASSGGAGGLLLGLLLLFAMGGDDESPERRSN